MTANKSKASAETPAPRKDGAKATTVPAAVASTTPAAPASASGSAWKKDFSTTDLTIGAVLGTAFFFLNLLDWSFGAWLMAQLTPESCSAASPIVYTLAQYYDFRLRGSSFLLAFDLVILLLLPLMIFGLVSDNVATVRGVRAPVGRHLLDFESLLQLAGVLTLTAAKAKPAMEAIVARVMGGEAGAKAADATGGDALLYAQLTQLVGVHFLILALNALQWFVPFLRLIVQRKQDAMKAKEEATAAATAAKAAAVAEKTAAASNAAAATAAKPTAEEMQRRMEQAEAEAEAVAAAADAALRKRK